VSLRERWWGFSFIKLLMAKGREYLVVCRACVPCVCVPPSTYPASMFPDKPLRGHMERLRCMVSVFVGDCGEVVLLMKLSKQSSGGSLSISPSSTIK